jgi:hypothetical protein
MTKFLQTEDGLISEHFLIRLDHNDPSEPWFITYAQGARSVHTRASAKAVAEFLQPTPRTT